MKLLVFLTTLTFLFSATSKFNVDGMMCGKGCVNKIKKHMGSLDGIKSCDVNFDKAIMTIEYDESKLNDQLIMDRLHDKTTYTCSPKQPDEPKKSLFKKIFGWF